MLFSKKQTLDEKIVEKLSYSPHLTLEELITDKNITLQGWYKALKRLVEQGIVIKQNKRYSLNTSWVVETLRWSHKLKNVYLEKEKEEIINLPKKERGRIVFRFQDLLTMDSFWAHLLVHIASLKPKDSIIYAYNHHFWFYLAHGESEKQYNRNLKELKVKTKMIVGSNSFLDKWNSQFFSRTNIEYYFLPKSWNIELTKSINYFGDYFIEVKIKKEMAKKIDQFFKKTESLADLSQVEVISLFQEKSPCTITVSRNKKKGEQFKRKIKRYF